MVKIGSGVEVGIAVEIAGPLVLAVGAVVDEVLVVGMIPSHLLMSISTNGLELNSTLQRML